ncbi:multidrug resistance-associated protein 1-like [Haliotis rufescens]|uniref:multidrug resistance-associated protein 1-like n=1 Tax=Haliotis rufescens TaxID=6454 RepID=UPI00201F1398|nr:multidrug resistance-associated protein 1-like [Haliotis rufescens]
MLLLLLERKKGLITSGVMFTFWLLLTLTGIVPFYSIILQEEDMHHAFQAVTFYIYYALVALELFLGCFAESSDKRSTDKTVWHSL